LTLVAALAPANANDTMAELRAGGLTFVASDTVEMASEDLSLSMDEVKVDYVFHNSGKDDVSSVIAFPMPDVQGDGDFMVTIPDETSDNFMDFSVTVDGQAIETRLDQHVFAAEVEVTDLLNRYKVPLQPYGERTSRALNALPKDVIAEMMTRGLVIDMPFSDTADGPMQDDYVPVWKLKTTYWWTATFPAGADVRVSHRYTPAVGSNTGLNFVNFEPPRYGGEAYDEEKAKYCFDAAFLKAVDKRLDAAKDGETPLVENWLGYVLTTGRNWGGAIGKFHLTIDKGSPDNLLSLCMDGLKKTGPTTFELRAADFFPQKDIDVLILTRPDFGAEQ
jgi:hypothetical protein